MNTISYLKFTNIGKSFVFVVEFIQYRIESILDCLQWHLVEILSK